jgi:hypothetical protein
LVTPKTKLGREKILLGFEQWDLPKLPLWHKRCLILAFLDTKPHISNERTIALWLTALVLLAAVAGGDFATGYQADFFAFYFLPVWLLARNTNLGSGIAIAILAAIAWFVVDHVSGYTYTSAAIGYWNGGVALAAYLAIACAASSLRRKAIAIKRLTADLDKATVQIERLRVMRPTDRFEATPRSSDSRRFA